MTRLTPAYIVAGALLILDQADHLYGTGTLRLLLPYGGVIPAGVDWLPVYGTEIGEDRKPRGERHALIRAAAIGEALAAGRRWLDEPPGGSGRGGQVNHLDDSPLR